QVRWVLLAAIGIHFFEHATGIEAVIVYSPQIFLQAGVTSKDKLLLATIGVGVTRTIFITASTFFINKAGRRKLLLTSVGGMIVSLVGLGFALTIIVHQSHDQNAVWPLWLSIDICYLYVVFFSMGLAPVTWVYSSEIFPLKLRAQGAGVGVAVNRATYATMSMTFLSLKDAITIGGALFLFAEMEQVFTRGRKSRDADVELQKTGKDGARVM
nr:probable polyol transporter 6 [Tanacetum cinerariifolium]